MSSRSVQPLHSQPRGKANTQPFAARARRVVALNSPSMPALLKAGKVVISHSMWCNQETHSSHRFTRRVDRLFDSEPSLNRAIKRKREKPITDGKSLKQNFRTHNRRDVSPSSFLEYQAWWSWEEVEMTTKYLGILASMIYDT